MIPWNNVLLISTLARTIFSAINSHRNILPRAVWPAYCESEALLAPMLTSFLISTFESNGHEHQHKPSYLSISRMVAVSRTPLFRPSLPTSRLLSTYTDLQTRQPDLQLQL